jgi:hypothetical protein
MKASALRLDRLFDWLGRIGVPTVKIVLVGVDKTIK